MAFHSSPSTAARPPASRLDARAPSVRARHKEGDSYRNEALPEDPTPASAGDKDSADFLAASVNLKAASEGSASLDGSRAGMALSCSLAPITDSAIDIPPMPGREPDTHHTIAIGSPNASTGASETQFRSLPPDGIADALSVTSEVLSTRGAKSGSSREHSDPTDTILLPASADATRAESPRATHGDSLERDARDERGAGTAPHSHDTDSGSGTGPSAVLPLESDPDFEASSLDRIVDALADPSTWVEASTPDFGASLGGASSVHETKSPGLTASNGLEGSPDSELRPREDPEPTVIALPDLSGETAGDINDGFLRQVADAPAVSSDRPDGRDDSDASEYDGVFPRDAGAGLDEIGAPSRNSALWTGGAGETAPSPGEITAPVSAFGKERLDSGDQTTSKAFMRAEVPSAPADGSLDDGLIRNIADAPSVSSDGDDAQTPASGDGESGGHPEEFDDTPAIPVVETAFDSAPPDRGVAHPEAADGLDDAELHDIPFETVPPGPSRALAFAADSDTEAALRDGLLGYVGSSPDHGDPQVWQGGIRAAIAALNEGHSAPLIFVDIDLNAYPAGAIHELAAVCEVGTVVIALGSDNSARPSRELLLAGVSDYLAKPLTAEAVRAAATRAAPDAEVRRPGGCVAGFVGCGGSGATTLLAAAALQAAERGCYVSVLDLDRSVSAAALALGVEPAAGLDQLLEAAGRGMPDPEMVEGVRTLRSDRIHVYAHRWSTTLPGIPSPEALDTLLAVLRDRSQLVLVDGLDEPAFRFCPSPEFDARVFVAEPTTWNVAHLGRTTNLLGGDPPLLFVQNHTRAFKRGRGERALRNAGLGITPDITIPFEPALPEATDRGWPQPRLPRSLRKPMRALTDRILEPSRVVGTGVAAHPAGSA